MEFLNPNFLYLLVLLVLLVLSRIVFFSKRNASLQVSNIETLKLFFNKGALFKIFVLNSLFFIALSLLIIALARPRISSSDKIVTVDVVDIVQLVDKILYGDNSEFNSCWDLNADGTINIIDVVSLVTLIITSLTH